MVERPDRAPELSRTRREEVLRFFDNTCALCFNRFPFLQVHHIVPRSSTGSNDFENLMPLCSECHDVIHRVYSFFNLETFFAIRERAVKCIDIRSAIIKQISINVDVFETLFRSDICHIVSTSGWHTPFIRIIEESLINENSKKNTLTLGLRNINIAILSSFLGELHLYSNLGTGLRKGLHLLKAAYKKCRIDPSLADATCFIATALSKGYELSYQRKNEARILSEVSSLNMTDKDIRNIWLWRYMCYLVNVHKLEEAKKIESLFVFDADSDSGRKTEANVLSIIGHFRGQYDDDIDFNIRNQIISLKTAIKIFHKRGIYKRAFNIAQLYFTKEDFLYAIKYLNLAKLFSECGHIKQEWDAERLLIRLRKLVGIDLASRMEREAGIPNTLDLSHDCYKMSS